MSYPANTLYPTDQDIIRNLSNGNRRKGEEDLFNSYAYFIKEGARKYRLPEDEAFDAYSDTVLSAIEKITRGLFEGRSSLKTWLSRFFKTNVLTCCAKNDQ